LLSLWYVIVTGFTFFEAFILPLLASDSPKFAESFLGIFTGSVGDTSVGALATLWTLLGVVYILGSLLFGIATFRAGILSRWAAALLGLGAASSPAFCAASAVVRAASGKIQQRSAYKRGGVLDDIKRAQIDQYDSPICDEVAEVDGRSRLSNDGACDLASGVLVHLRLNGIDDLLPMPK